MAPRGVCVKLYHPIKLFPNIMEKQKSTDLIQRQTLNSHQIFICVCALPNQLYKSFFNGRFNLFLNLSLHR